MKGNPTHPDFRVWNNIGPLYVYAHDDFLDYREWNIADVRNHLTWQGIYLDLITPNVGIQTLESRDIGMQLTNGLVAAENNEEENANENENEEMEEEEKEEDPKEDPNWVNEELPRTPTLPIIMEENVNHEPNSTNWDFNQDLDIPDYGRMEPKSDSIVWRDIHEVNEYPRAVNEVVHEMMEIENEGEVIMREARETIDQVWEEVGRELRIEENNESEQRARDEEEEEE